MAEIKILFETAEPIQYTEIDLDYYLDLYVLCRISGSVIVTEYPEEYRDENGLTDAVKNISLPALKDCLQNVHESCSGKMFYTSEDRDVVLKKAIEEALIKKGIQAEAGIALFSLDSDSEAEINAYKKQYAENHGPVMHVDQALRREECFGGNNDGNPNSFSETEGREFPVQKSASDAAQEGEWICPNCNAKGNKGNFCTECGTQRP